MVHLDPDMPEQANFATSVTAVLAPGASMEGIALGVEIAQRAKAITGRGTSFGVASTGVYGQVQWLVLYDTIEEVQAANEAINADVEFGQLIDQKASKTYLAGQSAQAISRRLV